MGIDLGGVIIDRVNDGTDTSFFGERYLETTAVPGAFATIAQLVPVFDGRIWLVSKCGLRIQKQSLEWLDHHRFWEHTGVPREQIRFCLRREEKTPICQELNITHFVDDRPDVLIPMRGVVHHRYLFNPQKQDLRRFFKQLSGILVVRSWKDIQRFV